MKATINDIEYEGTPEELSEIIAILGRGDKDEVVEVGPQYYSESKQKFIIIKDMDDEHIKNAILKLYRSYLEDMKGSNNGFFLSMLDKLTFGFDDGDVYKEIDDLKNELDDRVNEE